MHHRIITILAYILLIWYSPSPNLKVLVRVEDSDPDAIFVPVRLQQHRRIMDQNTFLISLLITVYMKKLVVEVISMNNCESCHT